MAVRTPIGLSPEIPLVIKRELLKLSRISQTAQSDAQKAQKTADSKLDGDLNSLAFKMRTLLQPGGSAPIVLTGLLGHAAQPQLAGVPNLKKLPAGGPYAQPGSLVGVNGVLYGYTVSPNTPQLPYVQPGLTGTHAQRLSLFPATNYPPGMLFWETDRTVFYIVKLVSSVPTWVYAAGIMPVTQALLPNDLGVPDGGFLALVSDYPGHLLLWNGITWQYGPGDPGTRWTVIGDTSGNPPQGGLWGLCDGSSYNCLNGDGTVSSVPTHNLTGDVVIQGGAVAGQQAATQPTWDPAAITDGESLHTHSVTEGSSLLASFSYQAGGTLQNIFGVAGGTVTSGPGSIHWHALTNAFAKLNPPSEANGGMPKRTAVLWYMRR